MIETATPKNNKKLPKGTDGSSCNLYKPTETAIPKAKGKAIPATATATLVFQSKRIIFTSTSKPT